MLHVLVVEEERPDGAFALLTGGLPQLPVERLERCLLQAFPRERIDADGFHLLVFAPQRADDALIAALVELKRRNGRLFIVLALPPDCDLGFFIRPSVQPSGVLFVPLIRDKLFAMVREIDAERARTQDAGPVFSVKTGGETFFVETSRIYFFEAKSKKIALKTDTQEILFYSSFEKIQSRLPPSFVRCHKGFLINTALIRVISYADMLVTMRDESLIPISRTGKQALQAALDSPVNTGGLGL